jgi:hypothetical protein
MTGWELALGKEPVLRTEGSVSADTEQKVRDKLDGVAGAVRFLGIMTAIALVLGVVVGVTDARDSAAALIASAVLTVLAVLAVPLSAHSGMGGVDVKLHAGYLLSLLLTFTAAAVDICLYSVHRHRDDALWAQEPTLERFQYYPP